MSIARDGIALDNRERSWYEAEHGEHPPICDCPDCREARRCKDQSEEEIAIEQAKMRTGAEARVRALKEKAQHKDAPQKIDWSWLK